MQLLLFHSGVASFTCADCKKYLYDFTTGKQKTFKSGPKREELPMLRPANVETPCKTCPKESPEREKDHDLSDRNYKTLMLYHRARATNYGFLNERELRDPIVATNFATLDRIYREYERQRQTADLVEQLVPALVRRNG